MSIVLEHPAPAGPAPAPPKRRPRRRPLLIALGIVVVVGLVAGLLVWAPWVNRVPAAPSAVSGSSPTASAVLLHWAGAKGGPHVDRYLVLRDGAQVASLGAGTTSFRDEGLEPGTTHRYRVIAVSGEYRSGPSATVVVTTITPAPTGLAAKAGGARTVQLAWSAPPDSPMPDSYSIVRNGTPVASVPGGTTTYTDAGLSASTTYRYQVSATWGSQHSALSAVAVATTLPPPPQRLAATAAATTVVLHWARPPGVPLPTSYALSRDGKQIGTVPGTATSFTDAGRTPSSQYRYELVAAWGSRRSEAATVVVTTRASDVPLRGQYTVQIKITGAPGGGASGQAGDHWTDTWTATPKCAQSNCAVSLSGGFAPPDYTYHSFQVTLSRAGTTYTGSTTAHLTHCGAEPLVVDVQNTVTLRITGNASLPWTSWSGTMQVDAPFTLAGSYYCPAETWTTSLAGSS